MLRSHFTIAWRDLLRYKIYSVINVLGLATGMAACLLIMLFVGYEWGFDRMHRKHVFRLGEVQRFEGMVLPQKVPLTAFAMGPALNADFPEVANYTHLIANGNVLLHHGQKHIPIPGSFFADTSFFQVFDFRLLAGDPKTALAGPGCWPSGWPGSRLPSNPSGRPAPTRSKACAANDPALFWLK